VSTSDLPAAAATDEPDAPPEQKPLMELRDGLTSLVDTEPALAVSMCATRRPAGSVKANP